MALTIYMASHRSFYHMVPWFPQRKTRSNNTEPRPNVKLHTTKKPKQNNCVLVGANPIRLWFKGGEDMYFSLRTRPALQSLVMSAWNQLSTLQDSNCVTLSLWLDKKQLHLDTGEGSFPKWLPNSVLLWVSWPPRTAVAQGRMLHGSGEIFKKERRQETSCRNLALVHMGTHSPTSPAWAGFQISYLEPSEQRWTPGNVSEAPWLLLKKAHQAPCDLVVCLFVSCFRISKVLIKIPFLGDFSPLTSTLLPLPLFPPQEHLQQYRKQFSFKVISQSPEVIPSSCLGVTQKSHHKWGTITETTVEGDWEFVNSLQTSHFASCKH